MMEYTVTSDYAPMNMTLKYRKQNLQKTQKENPDRIKFVVE